LSLHAQQLLLTSNFLPYTRKPRVQADGRNAAVMSTPDRKEQFGSLLAIIYIFC